MQWAVWTWVGLIIVVFLFVLGFRVLGAAAAVLLATQARTAARRRRYRDPLGLVGGHRLAGVRRDDRADRRRVPPVTGRGSHNPKT